MRETLLRMLLISGFFLPIVLYGQLENKADAKQKMDIFQKMNDPDVNFYDVQKEAEEYYKTHDNGKGSGYKQYKRWEYFHGTRSFPSGNTNIDGGQAWKEITKYKKNYPAKKASSPWVELGPKTSANITTHWAPGIGRINEIAIHPTNYQTIYVGTPAGGLWKTTNEGATWTPMTDDIPAIGVSAIAIDTYNTNTIYIGTGDRDARNTYSVGVLKSTDGGNTWAKTGLEYEVKNKRTVGVLRIKPGTSNTILAGASDGLYRSTDSGITWTKILTGNCEDIEFKPNDANTVYAVSKKTDNNMGFFKSTDGGATFTEVTSGLPTSRRAFISVTKGASHYVYLVSSNTSGKFGGVYRSTNSGGSFGLRGNQPDIFGYEADDGRSQSYYDLCMAVSPTKPEEVHVGGITTWKSTNGGQTWTQTSKWYYTTWLTEQDKYRYIHCDMHALEYSSNGANLYSGSDGMICKTTDGFATHANTKNLTEGLGIRQFYGIGLSATDANKYIGGSQDNGTSVTIDGKWSEWLGADGGDAVIDWSNSDIIYGTIQNGGEWYQSTDGGTTKISKTGPGGGNWVVPWVMDYNDPNIIYVGCSEVRKTTDQMNKWVSISNFGEGGNIDKLAVAPSNSDYLYVSKKISNVENFFRTKDGGKNWENITGTLPNLGNTYITVHPSNPSMVAVSFSGYEAGKKVYTSTDAGTTWTNFSGNLPNLPANCVLYHDITENGLYVGMDVGVYYRDNTKTDWESFFDGLPNVIVIEMEIHYGTNKLRAGTFGRGLWETNVAVSKNLLCDFAADKRKVFPNKTITFTDKSSALNGTTISSWQWTFPGGSPASFNGKTPPAINYANEGEFDVTLTVTSGSKTTTKTKTKFIKIAEEYSMGAAEVVTCSGKFYSSGLYYNYDDKESLTTTIKPATAGKKIVVDFVRFELEYDMDCGYDYLEIYDGTSTSATLIGKFCASNNPGTVIATNSDGALTFKFVSDDHYNAKGFEADIRCE